MGLRDLFDANQRKIEIKSVSIHQQYAAPSHFSNDIAVIKLSERVDIDQQVQPVDLPEAADQDFIDWSVCSVTGWGTLTCMLRFILCVLLSLRFVKSQAGWMVVPTDLYLTGPVYCFAI